MASALVLPLLSDEAILSLLGATLSAGLTAVGLAKSVSDLHNSAQQYADTTKQVKVECAASKRPPPCTPDECLKAVNDIIDLLNNFEKAAYGPAEQS